MRVSAKTDYALRAAVELAALEAEWPVKAERIADAQDIPLAFLENILGELRHAGIVDSRRGPEGGFLLARPPDEISMADVIRTPELAVEVTLQPAEKSFTDEQIGEVSRRIVAAAEKLGAKLRS